MADRQILEENDIEKHRKNDNYEISRAIAKALCWVVPFIFFCACIVIATILVVSGFLIYDYYSLIYTDADKVAASLGWIFSHIVSFGAGAITVYVKIKKGDKN